MMIDTFLFNGVALRADPPIEVRVHRMSWLTADCTKETYGLFRAEVAWLGVECAEKTQDKAINKLNDMIVNLWVYYVMTDDNELDDDSLEFKSELLKRFKDVTP